MSQIRHFSSLMLLRVGYKDEPSTSTTSCETISYGLTGKHSISITLRGVTNLTSILRHVTSETSSQYGKYSRSLHRGGLFLASVLLLQRFRNAMTLSSTAWPCIYYFSGVPSPGASKGRLCASNTIRLSPNI